MRLLSIVLAISATTALVFGCIDKPADGPSNARITAPKIWDDTALSTWATELPGLEGHPVYLSSDRYYAVPVDNLRTYPVYHPSREPPGYREWILEQGPQPLIEVGEPRSDAEWIAAGARIFEELDTAASRSGDPRVVGHFTDAAAIDAFRKGPFDVVTKDGILLDYRWVVDLDGTLKVGLSSCSGCHSRLMSDGSVLLGAPGNFDLSDAPAVGIMLDQLDLLPKLSKGESFYAQFGVPWRGAEDPHVRYREMPEDALSKFRSQDAGNPPGTMFARFNGSPLYSTRMADLRGIKNRKYLDVTGTHKNREPADIARYGILVEFADQGVFGSFHMLPDEAMVPRRRPPDEAMYAMARYLYSLEPAKSPHALDESAARGKAVFEKLDCGSCHSPPNYTNESLIAAEVIGTDPGLATMTRKGTGKYRVPSLRGLWYRGLYEHSGSLASLDEWFDRARLRSDFRPSGWRGLGVETRSVPGHEFGLDLPPADKADLIHFLLTL